MSKRPERLEDYSLFYEEIGSDHSEQALEFEQAKQEAAYERDGGLSEGEVAKLSEDLRQPIKDSSSSNSL